MNSQERNRRTRIIETDAFPFEFLSAIAQRESWRKEIYRPVYHLHKWWAKRLGSVFRGIILGCLLPEHADLENAFYKKHQFSDLSVFDPFFGSGTTIGEAHKLGCVSLGCDINPIACESLRVALGALDRNKLQKAFNHLGATVGKRIRASYTSKDEDGRDCDVLYYFWVKQVPCPACGSDVDLFNHYLVARNAYPDRKPEVQIVCPRCGDIFCSLNGLDLAICKRCGFGFNPHVGTASRSKAKCPACSESFSIVSAIRRSVHAPAHRLYAKLLLTPGGQKKYLPTTPEDLRRYEECSALLRDEVDRGTIRIPRTALTAGYNTRQALSYNYGTWRDFFNDRQLLALGWLQNGISQLTDSDVRDALFTLFSGLLEFNNLFASYKGEGTGAVRHMFSHHILKPERMPIEANLWGTPKSSGSFSNLFKTRLLRALDYRARPFEVAVHGSGKVYGCSQEFSGRVEEGWPRTRDFKERGIYLSCCSSHDTGLPDCCVDLVITDPPFFDNVHYSELADFFFAWQELYPHGFLRNGETTRNAREVQDADAEAFASKLRNVFAECYRVLKSDGALVFTYHHSRPEGWTAVLKAVLGAGFSVVNAHPVKAEMSVATPKSQAKEPIQMDVILVCVKSRGYPRFVGNSRDAAKRAIEKTCQKIARIESVGLELSENDRRVMLFSQFIAEIGEMDSVKGAVEAFRQEQPALEMAAKRLLKICRSDAVQPSFRRFSGDQISLEFD